MSQGSNKNRENNGKMKLQQPDKQLNSLLGDSTGNKEIQNQSQYSQNNDSTCESEQDPICFHHDIQNLYKAVGILRCQWLNLQGGLETVNYGTAFMVTNQIIMTCTHNIFSQRRSQFCSQIYFLPSAHINSNQQNQLCHKSAQGHFYRCLTPHNSLHYKPYPAQVCLIALEESIKGSTFFSVGNLASPSESYQKRITTIGYPTSHHNSNYDLAKLKAERRHTSGRIKGIEGNIIHHTASTQKGSSGGPLIVQSEEGEWKVIGIHTHKALGHSFNSGVYFTPELIKTVKGFEAELRRAFDLSQTIQYSDQDETEESEQWESSQEEGFEDFPFLSSDISQEQSEIDESGISVECRIPSYIQFIKNGMGKSSQEEDAEELSDILFSEEYDNFYLQCCELQHFRQLLEEEGENERCKSGISSSIATDTSYSTRNR